MKNLEIEDTLAFINENTDLNSTKAILYAVNERNPGVIEAFRSMQALGDGDLPSPVRMSEVKSEPLEWLWRGWLPVGKYCTLSGDPGVGKSCMTLEWAAAISKGRAFPLESIGREPANVLLFIAEDGLGDTVRPRLEAMGADLNRIHAFDTEATPEASIALLRTQCERLRPALIIIDPLSSFIPTEAEGSKMSDLRKKFLNPLKALAEEYACTVVGLVHLNKSALGDNPLYRSAGRIDYATLARSAMICAKDPQNADCYILANAKTNLMKSPQCLRYGIEDRNGVPVIDWQGIAEGYSASGLLAPSTGQSERVSVVEDAQNFLFSELANGAVPYNDLLKRAKLAGFSEAAIKRAKDGLAKSEKLGGRGEGWAWRLLPAEERDEKVNERLKRFDPQDNNQEVHSFQSEPLESLEPLELLCPESTIKSKESNPQTLELLCNEQGETASLPSVQVVTGDEASKRFKELKGITPEETYFFESDPFADELTEPKNSESPAWVEPSSPFAIAAILR